MSPKSYLQENFWATTMCWPSVYLMLADITACDNQDVPPLYFDIVIYKQIMIETVEQGYTQYTVIKKNTHADNPLWKGLFNFTLQGWYFFTLALW